MWVVHTPHPTQPEPQPTDSTTSRANRNADAHLWPAFARLHVSVPYHIAVSATQPPRPLPLPTQSISLSLSTALPERATVVGPDDDTRGGCVQCSQEARWYAREPDEARESPRFPSRAPARARAKSQRRPRGGELHRARARRLFRLGRAKFTCAHVRERDETKRGKKKKRPQHCGGRCSCCRLGWATRAAQPSTRGSANGISLFTSLNSCYWLNCIPQP